MSQILDAVTDFFVRFFDPVVPREPAAWVVHFLCAILLTLVALYVAALIFIRWQSWDQRKRRWTTDAIVTRTYGQTGLFIAVLWTAMIAYCYLARSPASWVALIPYWVGVVTALVVVVATTVSLRKRVREVSKRIQAEA